MQNVSLISVLKTHAGTFAPVVPFNPAVDKLHLFRFGPGNHELTPDVLQDTDLFSRYINEKLAVAKARYGIGGYAEHRVVYGRSELFGKEGTESGEEPRRLHLGTDIWGKPYTAVKAPVDAVVHSFAFNDHFGDYGATIILTHQLSGVSFHTLYGHLSLNSIKNLREGEIIRKGDVFAEFGIPQENGHWPPHLHFQVIVDLEGWVGDYPGVCKFSEKEKWLNNCPDPDLVLQMNKYISVGEVD